MSRIDACFAEMKKKKRAALIPFIMGGDPSLSTSAAVLAALPKAGADLIEIGMPFSDPMADGPTIQAAGRRALKAGATVSGILKLVRGFRAKDNKTPIILMGYYNPIFHYGPKKFCSDAAKAGVDGLIIVDLPPEEERAVRPHATQNKLSIIRLIAPTTNDKRLYSITRTASGFVYYISVTGTTGEGSANINDLRDELIHVHRFTPLPIAVGFGIRTPNQAARIGRFAHAVVVGSALIEAMEGKKSRQAAVGAATAFIRSMAKALR